MIYDLHSLLQVTCQPIHMVSYDSPAVKVATLNQSWRLEVAQMQVTQVSTRRALKANACTEEEGVQIPVDSCTIW